MLSVRYPTGPRMLAECATETDVTEYQNIFAWISEDGNEEKAKENIFVSSFFTTDCHKSTNTLCKCRELNESSDCASWIILHESTRPFHWISAFYRIRARRGGGRERERENRFNFSASVSAHFVCSADFGILIRAQVVAIIAHIRFSFYALFALAFGSPTLNFMQTHRMDFLTFLNWNSEWRADGDRLYDSNAHTCHVSSICVSTCKFCVKCLRGELELIRSLNRLLTQPNILNVNITFAPKSFPKRHLRHIVLLPFAFIIMRHSPLNPFYVYNICIFVMSLRKYVLVRWRRAPLERSLCSFLLCHPGRNCTSF